MNNAGRRNIHAQAACREAGLYGAATDCASPTRGRIGENSWCVPANGAKTDAIGIERRRDRTGRAQRRVVEMDVAVGTQRPRPGSAQLPRHGRRRPFDDLTLPAPRPAMSMRQTATVDHRDLHLPAAPRHLQEQRGGEEPQTRESRPGPEHQADQRLPAAPRRIGGPCLHSRRIGPALARQSAT